MNQPPTDWEGRIEDLASVFTYPPTPDLSRKTAVLAVASLPTPPARLAVPRWAWAFAIILALAAGLLAVPGVRAAVAEVLRLGAVRIFLVEPTPAPGENQHEVLAPPASTPPPSPLPATPVPLLFDLTGETSLVAAREQTPFSILLPSYPSALGEPDRVFVQDLDGPAVLLVWLDPDREGQVRLSLTQIGAGVFFDKRSVRSIEDTSIEGRWALWIDGPHLLQARNGDQVLQRLVEQGHVLLWEQGGVTYRLETDLPLTEARKVAESLAHEADR